MPPDVVVRPEFDFHALNEQGSERALRVAQIFSVALESLDQVIVNSALTGRARSLLITKLEEAKMWATRAVCLDPANQDR